MGSALREAWVWLLVAFILGLVAGSFLTKLTAREGTATRSTATRSTATRSTTTRSAATRVAPLGGQQEESNAANEDAAVPIVAAERSSGATLVAAVRAAKRPASTRSHGTRRQTTQAPVLDLVAAKAVIGNTVRLDDLKLIEGIGPRIEGLFKADGITTWREVSTANVERLQGILAAAAPRYKIPDSASWPKQAGLLADGKWAEFKTLNDKLKGGR